MFPLRTHLPQDVKTLARKPTLLSDIGFAAVLQRVEPMAPGIMETLRMELCLFQIKQPISGVSVLSFNGIDRPIQVFVGFLRNAPPRAVSGDIS